MNPLTSKLIKAVKETYKSAYFNPKTNELIFVDQYNDETLIADFNQNLSGELCVDMNIITWIIELINNSLANHPNDRT